MNYISICSGIEAATVAFHKLGWTPLAFSEIEPFPCAVLNYHYPNVPNLGDMTLYENWDEELLSKCDLIIGGCPCQSFSIAGLKKSLTDERGNLTLIYIKLINRIDEIRSKYGYPPVIILYENVPGLFNTKDNAFGNFLGGLVGETKTLEPPRGKWTNAGYVFGPQRSIAWRVLDAQYFGLAQRRKRIFLIGSARKEFSPEKILFEFESKRRDTPQIRIKRKSITTNIETSINDKINLVNLFCNDISPTVSTAAPFSKTGNTRVECDALVVCGSGNDPDLMSTLCATDDKKWGSNQWVNEGKAIIIYNLDSIQSNSMKSKNPNSGCNEVDLSICLLASGVDPSSNQGGIAVVHNLDVRRLTPIECERLQGFPDNYTNIPYRNKNESPDGGRYKALGNSMAVPVILWIGSRLEKY